MDDPRFFRRYLDIILEAETPKVTNVIVPPSADAPALLRGRIPTSPEQVTHAYRNMSSAEFDSAMKSGHFTANPNPGKTTWDTSKKFWSQGDVEGHFGRTWKAGKDAINVRVPVANVPSETAVSANHVEYKHPKTGEWTKMRLPAGGGMSGSVANTRDLQLGAELDPKQLMQQAR